MQYKHILIATDLLEGHEALIKRAQELGKEFNADINMIHVVEPLPGYGYAFISPAEIEKQLLDEAKQQLEKVGQEHGIPADHLHVILGPTKVEILDLSEEKNIDLIVIGTHHRHGLGHLLGSTANAIIHSANCDVLTVRVNGDEKK